MGEYQQLKSKYDKVKEKCFTLNVENDFYNKCMSVFMVIKKVLLKQNGYLTQAVQQQRQSI